MLRNDKGNNHAIIRVKKEIDMIKMKIFKLIKHQNRENLGERV